MYSFWRAVCRVIGATMLTIGVASAEPSRADQLISALKSLCLSGKQYDLTADAKGNLTLFKLTPGGQGKISVNVRESEGAAAIFDDKLRIDGDQNIRDCIKPFIPEVVNAIKEQTTEKKK